MIKNCVRCKEEINTAEERYIIVKDNNGKENLKTLWYHKKCWHEIMTGKGALNQMIQKANKLFGIKEDKIGTDNKEEIYEIN